MDVPTREAQLARETYLRAAERIFRYLGYAYIEFDDENVEIRKGDRILYVTVIGRQLPFMTEEPQEEMYPWVTRINPGQVQATIDAAERHKAEPWFCFCYALMDDVYKRYFRPIIEFHNIPFTAEMANVYEFERAMVVREPEIAYLEHDDIRKVLKSPVEI